MKRINYYAMNKLLKMDEHQAELYKIIEADL